MQSFLPNSNYAEINEPVRGNNKTHTILKWMIGSIAMIALIGLVLYNNENGRVSNKNMVINAKVVLSPTCNFAATDTYFYPIGGCESERVVDDLDDEVETTAFKYVCFKGEVFKVTYKKDKCVGKPELTIRVTDDLRDFKCDGKKCDIAQACSITGCVIDGDCSECKKPKNKKKFNKRCRPYIVGECFGNLGELLQQNTCDPKKNLLTESFYFGESCSGDPLFFDELGSNDPSINCKDDSFTTARC